MAQSADDRVMVRKVTDVHANWSEQGEGEPGKFSVQLVLDNGAVEHVARPTAQDTKVFLKLLAGSESIYYDLERGVTVFSDVTE
ncbi:hypothetical protein [Rubrobacter aplysinae]|uniref:hypothetical protein n=1 Tax=Rubrobacter aplysinae TaxID=909625 RepID=UPI00064BB640|nr:hypothetical protein [Rubrobacter aplysinae]